MFGKFTVGLESYTYNLGQNKMEQQPPHPPKSRMKPREGQNRATFPSLIWGGEEGLRFPFILSKIQPRPQGFYLKKWVWREKPHPFFKGKALGTRLVQDCCKVTRSYCLILNISGYIELSYFFVITSPLHLAVLHFILLVLVQTINCANCALSELSKTFVHSDQYSGIAVRVLNHRYIVEVAVGFQIVQKQIKEMRSTHTTLHCSFTDLHPITHRTVAYQPLLSIRQETNIPSIFGIRKIPTHCLKEARIT